MNNILVEVYIDFISDKIDLLFVKMLYSVNIYFSQMLIKDVAI